MWVCAIENLSTTGNEDRDEKRTIYLSDEDFVGGVLIDHNIERS
jgi:hypothetical protein